MYPPKSMTAADGTVSQLSGANDEDEDLLAEKSTATFSTASTKKTTSSNQTKKGKKKYQISKSYVDYSDMDNLVFSASLFEAIQSLLTDPNQKVKLAAAIAIFIILRQFKRPMNEKIQLTKNSAEKVLRDILDLMQNNADKYTAAQCLSIG